MFLRLVEHQLLLADTAGRGQAFAALERRLSLGQRGLRLHQLGIGCFQIDLDGGRVEPRKHLTLLDHIADIGQQTEQTQSADLRTDTRFLPGHDVALGVDLLRASLRLLGRSA